MKRFLHVGCGPLDKTKTTIGFNTDEWEETRYDIDESVHPDILGTMTDMSMVEAESYEGIYSSHNIEHLPPHEVGTALSEFRRVLKPDGLAVITCPDMISIATLVAEDKLTDTAYISPMGPITPLDMLYGHIESLKQGRSYMAHRSGFTGKTMRESLVSAGFKTVATNTRPQYFDLWALALPYELEEEKVLPLFKQYCVK